VFLGAEFESCAVDELKRRSLASEVFYKEMFVDKSQLAGAMSKLQLIEFDYK
jgi:hypothetical protein